MTILWRRVRQEERPDYHARERGNRRATYKEEHFLGWFVVTDTREKRQGDWMYRQITGYDLSDPNKREKSYSMNNREWGRCETYRIYGDTLMKLKEFDRVVQEAIEAKREFIEKEIKKK